MVVYASEPQHGEGQLDLWLQRHRRRVSPSPSPTTAHDDRAARTSRPTAVSLLSDPDRAGGGVYVMPALGGNARLVAEGGRRPRFSPDGSRIAFWTGPWLAGAGCARAWILSVHRYRPTAANRRASRTDFWTAARSGLGPRRPRACCSSAARQRTTHHRARSTGGGLHSTAENLCRLGLTGSWPSRGSPIRLKADVVGGGQEPLPAIWTEGGRAVFG